MRSRRNGLGTAAIIGLSCGLGCGAAESVPAPDSSPLEEPALDPEPSAQLSAIYDPAHVVEVEVDMDPADWAVLLGEGRSLFDVFQRERLDYEYSEFTAAAPGGRSALCGRERAKEGFSRVTVAHQAVNQARF